MPWDTRRQWEKPELRDELHWETTSIFFIEYDVQVGFSFAFYAVAVSLSAIACRRTEQI